MRYGTTIRCCGVITYVLTQCPFDAVGFRNDDILAADTAAALFTNLYDARGRIVTVEVIDGGNGSPLRQRILHHISVALPAEGP